MTQKTKQQQIEDLELDFFNDSGELKNSVLSTGFFTSTSLLEDLPKPVAKLVSHLYSSTAKEDQILGTLINAVITGKLKYFVFSTRELEKIIRQDKYLKFNRLPRKKDKKTGKMKATCIASLKFKYASYFAVISPSSSSKGSIWQAIHPGLVQILDILEDHSCYEQQRNFLLSGYSQPKATNQPTETPKPPKKEEIKPKKQTKRPTLEMSIDEVWLDFVESKGLEDVKTRKALGVSVISSLIVALKKINYPFSKENIKELELLVVNLFTNRCKTEEQTAKWKEAVRKDYYTIIAEYLDFDNLPKCIDPQVNKLYSKVSWYPDYTIEDFQKDLKNKNLGRIFRENAIFEYEVALYDWGILAIELDLESHMEKSFLYECNQELSLRREVQEQEQTHLKIVGE